MSRVTRSFYQNLLPPSDDRKAIIKPGMRRSATARLNQRRIDQLKKFGFGVDDNFLIEQQLLASLPLDPGSRFNIAMSKGRKLLDDITLRAELPKISIPCPVEINGVKVVTGKGHMEFSAGGSAEIGWTMGFERPDQPQNTTELLCKLQLGIELDKGDTTGELTVVYGMDNWKNAFWIPGFDFDRHRGKIGVDTEGNTVLGSTTQLTLNIPGMFETPKTAGWASKIKINLKTVIPTPRDIAVRYGIDEESAPGKTLKLNSHEVANLLNYAIKNAKPVLEKAGTIGRQANIPQINVSKLPKFGVEDFRYFFAPLEGDEDLRIEQGWGFKGKLTFANKSAMVDAKVRWMESPEASIKARFPDLNLEGLSVSGINLDLLLSSTNVGDSHFKLGGKIDFCGASGQSVNVDLNKDRFYFHLRQNLNGVFDTNFESEAVPGRGRWTFHGKVNSKLADLGNEASREVRNAAANANQKLVSAIATLEREEKKIKDKKSERDRAKIKAEADLAEFKRLSKKVADQQSVVDKLPKFARGAATSLLNKVTRARSDFARKAPWANNALKEVNRRGQQTAGAVAAEADPRVAKLTGEIATLEVGLKTAKGAVELARKGVTGGLGEIAKALSNQPIVVDSMNVSGQVQAGRTRDAAGHASVSANVTVEIAYRVLGKRKTFRKSMLVRDLTVKQVANQLVTEVKKLTRI